MPFTAAHPSILLPLFRVRWLSATGLIAGSISPDFENFLTMSTGDVHGHTLPGLFYFDLPVALLIAVVFHELVRDPLTVNLPGWLRRRLEGRWTFDFKGTLKRRWPLFTLSCLIGAATHLGWDQLTHNGWAATHLEFYHSWSVRIGELDYPPFYVLQQVSTVLGTGAILFYILMLTPRPIHEGRQTTWWFWPGVAAVFILMMWIRLSRIDFNYDRDLGDVIVSGVTSLLAGMILMAILARKRFESKAKG